MATKFYHTLGDTTPTEMRLMLNGDPYPIPDGETVKIYFFKKTNQASFKNVTMTVENQITKRGVVVLDWVGNEADIPAQSIWARVKVEGIQTFPTAAPPDDYFQFVINPAIV